jgi:CelD/BcsL family acetyltransferase involved in cellulose biosynthesis
MQVRVIGQSDFAAWDRMVEDHPCGCVFQTSAFRRVIAETFAHCRPIYLALVDDDGAFKAGLPLFLVKSWLTGTRLVSLPFVNYSDPLVRSTEELELLFDRALAIYNEERASYIEIKARNSTEVLNGFESVTPVVHHKAHWIDLTVGLDRVWRGLHKTAVRQRIRRSEREGIAIRSAVSEHEVRTFYQILVMTRKRLGLPPQNYGFFQRTWDYLEPTGQADVLIAERADQIIGGAVVFLDKNTLHVSYVASKTEYWPLGVDQALFWNTIQMAVHKGCSVYDIGMTSLFDEGLLTYKRRWGAVEVNAPCFYYPEPRGVSSLNDKRRLSHRIMTMMWQKLPGPVLQMGGKVAYRHLG